jgi:hypothetical protein
MTILSSRIRANRSQISRLHHTLVAMFRPVLRRSLGAAFVRRPAAIRSYASSSNPVFQWEDPLGFKHLLTEEELAISETAERYCQEKMAPRVLGMESQCEAWRCLLANV